MKKLMLIMAIFFHYQAYGQIECFVKLHINEKVTQTKGFKFSIVTSTDTLNILDSRMRQKIFLIPINNDSIFAVFEYSSDYICWDKIVYPIKIEQNITRMEIMLRFMSNSTLEFLEEFIVDKFMFAKNVIIEPCFPYAVGAKPVFLLKNYSDTIFYGYSPIHHFFGSIQLKSQSKFNYGIYMPKESGSFCYSTVPDKPLTKYDSVYSYIPYYSERDKYVLRQKGKYRYSVVLGLEKYGTEKRIPIQLTYDGITKKKMSYNFEQSFEFEVK